ncbi:MAG TPA: TlpA disulfide reductase family protein [Vicinamibacteria bacterium]|nr:TlpA disulfide reductase family protein [Vicinamibacteria bacterium]
MLWQLPLLAALAATPAEDAEVRIVEYLRQHVKPGRELVVSDLYNRVFTAPEERAVLDRLFDTFFRIPLFAVQYQKATGRPPTLAEIGEQFRFNVPGQAEVMLRIMESDPRLPKFLARHARTGEIEKVEVEAILADPRFGRQLERTIAGFEGRPAPPFSIATYDGPPIASAALAGKPHVLYFWFTGCPPCVSTTPMLVELYRDYRPQGLEIVGVNADVVLEIPVDEAERLEHARRSAIPFPLAHLTPEMQAAYGQVSVFPTLFFVDRRGTIVAQLVSAPPRAALEEAIRLALR